MISVHTLKLSVDAQQLRGLPWIFSNQVHHLEDPALSPERTALVHIPLLDGFGIYTKTDLIAVRLLPRFLTEVLKNKSAVEEAVFAQALAQHISLLRTAKTRIFPFARNQCFRVAHGDADSLPGIVIDDYGTFSTIQSSCAAGDFLLPSVVSALAQMNEQPLLERSSGQARAMAGLPERTRWIRGKIDKANVSFAGLKLQFDPLRAQKTGLFLDQRKNLEFLSEFLSHENVKASSFLDICSYAGAWSSAGATAGLSSFTLIDADAQALAMARENIIQNSPDAQALGKVPTIETRHGDLFEELSKLKSQSRTWDVVVADPPAFAKSKKHLPEATKAYARLIKLAARATAPNGVLILCSCSKNMEAHLFWELCLKNLGSEWILLRRGEQSPDHTIGTTQASSEYLKCYFFQKRSLEHKENAQ
jgi:23S rRNA (cytosine1962-C5)-methyltransferase